ncbi:uncharacterized protein MYCGRDRAFT_106709 [Zymoseptoria tritici IPO323]|uniref:Uncharacterized protein n=1 Tax=Zymoseptoria tritici (strain CBS 115943 / IPO323) TaxID=336722 RepID=F9XS99_ZYMTI|nr:uncharacterized protein MYCGRDRAFT_106709 [Zymoseptoria tritici IPO323]EGP81874.1 hypothetical protein MYCGRDRAFT_106709 [Zymoseptoria tritici IPO323]
MRLPCALDKTRRTAPEQLICGQSSEFFVHDPLRRHGKLSAEDCPSTHCLSLEKQHADARPPSSPTSLLWAQQPEHDEYYLKREDFFPTGAES